MNSRFVLVLGMVSLSLGFLAKAQDTRSVIEPQMKPACSILISNKTQNELELANDQTLIQEAIDKCPQGQSVHLAPSNQNNSFVSGPLRLKSGVTLVVDRGATLFASSDAQLYDTGEKTCGTTNAKGRGCKPFITLENTHGSAIMGKGTIDGQGHRMVKGLNETWWEIARRAQRENSQQNVPRLIEARNSTDLTIYQITLKNSPNFHVTLKEVDGFTAWGIKIDSPMNARNTDGIDPISSKNITITKSFIRTGDDSIAIKAGDTGSSENISIVDNHFYNGHGMSIGSETLSGVKNVYVNGLSLEGGTSGIRIKSDISRGGTVEHIRYSNVCMRDVRLPIEITALYNPKAMGHFEPKYLDIEMNGVSSLTPGKVLLEGLPNGTPFQVKYQNVKLVGPANIFISNTLEPEGIEFNSNRADLRAQCQSSLIPFPAFEATSSRPELTDQEARAYQMSEVFKYAGPAGQESVDPWSPSFASPTHADYVVDQQLLVNDRKHFKTIQSAIEQVVKDLNATPTQERIFIEVHPGVYNEVVYVPRLKNPISIFGNGPSPEKTVISYNLDAALSGEEYAKLLEHEFSNSDSSIREMFEQVKARENITTFGTATLWTQNTGFQVSNLTIENGYTRGNPDCTSDCKGYNPNAMHQAVALMVDGADQSLFQNVRLLALQDTLYLKNRSGHQTSRSYFENAFIQGDVDYIFGDATAYFFKSEIKSLGSRKDSYVAAPSTNVHSRYGFVFDRCNFTNDNSKNAQLGQYRLARQWFHNQKCTPYGAMAIKDYACTLGSGDRYLEPKGEINIDTLQNVGKMVVMNSKLGSHLSKTNPWSDWNPMGKLSHRPVQYSSDDYLKNLQDIGASKEMILIESSRSIEPKSFLSEYQNTLN